MDRWFKRNGVAVETEKLNYKTLTKEDADLTTEQSTTITLKNNKSLPSSSEKHPAKKKRMILSICCMALLSLVMNNPQIPFVLYFVTRY